jgi:hypothetical protein
MIIHSSFIIQVWDSKAPTSVTRATIGSHSPAKESHMFETLILKFHFHHATEIVTSLPALNFYPCALNNWFLSITGFFEEFGSCGQNYHYTYGKKNFDRLVLCIMRCQ